MNGTGSWVTDSRGIYSNRRTVQAQVLAVLEDVFVG